MISCAIFVYFRRNRHSRNDIDNDFVTSFSTETIFNEFTILRSLVAIWNQTWTENSFCTNSCACHACIISILTSESIWCHCNVIKKERMNWRKMQRISVCRRMPTATAKAKEISQLTVTALRKSRAHTSFGCLWESRDIGFFFSSLVHARTRIKSERKNYERNV